MTFDEKNDRINVTMCKTNEKERKSHEETQKFIFRETGVCTGSGRCLCRSGKYMEISISGSKVRRRNVPSHLCYTCVNIRVYDDRCRICTRTHDKKKSGWGIQVI